MSAAWLVVILVGAFTIVFKAAGPVLVGDRQLPPRLLNAFELLAPALFAALVVTQALGGNSSLVFDERLVGVGAAGVAIRLHVPLIAVMAVAALATALVRLV